MSNGRLQATDLRRSIGDRVLFSDIQVDLEPGRTLVLSGPSGTGKTVLLRQLAALDPGQGQLSLDGRSPQDWGIPRWRRMVAYVSQQPPVMPGTPEHFTLRVQGLRSQTQMDDPLEIAHLLGLTHDQWGTRWQDLSGGERQRAHLAITLATRPLVLLLDEPTSALDPERSALVEDLVRPITAVWVTHDRAQAQRVADQTLELHP